MTSQSRFSNSSSLPNFSSSPLHWLKIEQRIQYKIIYITHNLLHSSTPSYLYRLLNIQPTLPTRSVTAFVWLILNPLLDSNSPIDLFVMLHLLFGANYQPPFVPSPQNQLMPTQCHSHHLPYLINHFLSTSRHFFHSLLSSLGSFYSLHLLPFRPVTAHSHTLLKLSLSGPS